MIQKSIERLDKVLNEALRLSEKLPNLESAQLIRRLHSDGYFQNLDYDYLLAYAISARALHYDSNNYCLKDKSRKAERIRVYCGELREQIIKAVKRPDIWMWQAVDEAANDRYCAITGKSLPDMNPGRIPQRLQNQAKKMDSAWPLLTINYFRMKYITEMVISSGFTLDVFNQRFSFLLTTLDLRDFVSAMQRPPQEVLTYLTEQSIHGVTVDMGHHLQQIGRHAESLQRLGYQAKPDSGEAKDFLEVAEKLNSLVLVKAEDCPERQLA